MNRPFMLVAILAATTSPVYAQSSETGYDWTGVYGGLELVLVPGSELTLSDRPGFSLEYDGASAGLFLGYRRDFGSVVVGGEYSVSSGQLEQSATFGGVPVEFGDEDDVFSPTIHNLGIEVGYDAGRALIYGTAGFARMALDVEAGTNTANGQFFGLGVDYRIGQFTFVGAEVLRHSFDDFSLSPTAETELTTINLSFGFSY